MNQPSKNVRVARTNERRAPKGIRKLGRALVALAQAQLEAEAQAEAAAKAAAKRRADESRASGSGDAA